MLLSKYKKKIYSLFNRKKKNAGRNNRGRITVAHQGNGHKQLYRKINFHENFDEKGVVVNIEYDPNRTAYIAKICSTNSEGIKKYFYILAPKNLKILDIITPTKLELINDNNQKQFGNFYYLKDFNVGDFIYNIELIPNKGGQIVRSAGSFAQILQKTNFFVTVALPSGEHRLIPNHCKACFGNVSNENH
jgi:large subunit ribosomal protein L2